MRRASLCALFTIPSGCRRRTDQPRPHNRRAPTSCHTSIHTMRLAVLPIAVTLAAVGAAVPASRSNAAAGAEAEAGANSVVTVSPTSRASSDTDRCVDAVNAVQGDFKAMLGQPDAAARLELAQRLAARFTPDGVMADPAWRPSSGHDAIAKAEAGTYLPVPGCTQGLTWALPRAVAGNSSFPPSASVSLGGKDLLVYCAVDVVYNVTLMSAKPGGGSCSIVGQETDTAVLDPATGMLTSFATIYDYAGFAGMYAACAAKVCGK